MGNSEDYLIFEKHVPRLASNKALSLARKFQFALHAN